MTFCQWRRRKGPAIEVESSSTAWTSAWAGQPPELSWTLKHSDGEQTVQITVSYAEARQLIERWTRYMEQHPVNEQGLRPTPKSAAP